MCFLKRCGSSLRHCGSVLLLQAWNSLPGSVRSGGRPSREEALQAVAVLNRVRRLLSETSGEGGAAGGCSAVTHT